MSSLRTALEARRGTVERARAVEGGLFVVEGFVDLMGVGETTIDVSFPVTFIEKPTIYIGGECGENQPIVDTLFPTWTGGVHRWNRLERPDVVWYRGANLILVVSGDPDNAEFQSQAWWLARGRALVNPATGGL